MKRAMALLLIVASLPGCYFYETSVRTSAAAPMPEYRRRQYFVFWGEDNVSSPAGGECGDRGVAWTKSSLDAVDVLVDVGLAVAGSIVAGTICPAQPMMPMDGSNPDVGQALASSSCIAGVELAATFFGTRTVRYRCAAKIGPADAPAPVIRIPRAPAEAGGADATPR